jgi:hypothetical protein
MKSRVQGAGGYVKGWIMLSLIDKMDISGIPM